MEWAEQGNITYSSIKTISSQIWLLTSWQTKLLTVFILLCKFCLVCELLETLSVEGRHNCYLWSQVLPSGLREPFGNRNNLLIPKDWWISAWKTSQALQESPACVVTVRGQKAGEGMSPKTRKLQIKDREKRVLSRVVLAEGKSYIVKLKWRWERRNSLVTQGEEWDLMEFSQPTNHWIWLD